jgi:hypothetical protein
VNNPSPLPALRAEIAHLKARLEDLDAFDAEWDGYATQLWEIVAQMAGREWSSEIPSGVRPMLEAAERTRVRIVTLGDTKFDVNYFARVEFAWLTGANLRTSPEE